MRHCLLKYKTCDTGSKQYGKSDMVKLLQFGEGEEKIRVITTEGSTRFWDLILHTLLILLT